MGKGYKNREKNRRTQITNFLIVCEGKETERKYFNNYKQRNSGLILFTPNSSVTDPENLVKFAKSQIHKNEINVRNGDQVWCVFDADANSNDAINKAKTLAGTEIKLCFSNPCFELWYLLHHCYYEQRISTDELLTKITEHIEEYDKSKDYSNILTPLRQTAINNATRLNDRQIGSGIDLLSLESNPSTQVVCLVQEMLRIIDSNHNRRS